jgi:DNA-binding beta-propeller fold protein YncE
MDYDATTGEVYVPDQQHNQLDVLAPVTPALMPREPTRIIHMSSSPQSVAITSDGQLGFVALANGQVIMLDIPARSSVATITVGGTPHFIITGLYPPDEAATNTSPQTTTSSSSVLSVLAGWLLVLTMVLLSFFWLFGRRRRRQAHKRRKDPT